MNTLVAHRRSMVAGVVAAAVLTAAFAAITWPHSIPTRRHDLAPTTSEVRYRFDPRIEKDARSELDATITEIEARQRAQPNDPIEMTELANLYYARAQVEGDPRDYDAAEQLARKSIAILPAPNGAALTLARLANARHAFHEAIDLAHAYKGRNGVAVPMVLATAYLALGELDHAMAAANAAVEAKPTPSTHLERALVLEAQGRDAEAAADFADAVRVEDDGDVLESARLRALWARFLVRRGEFEGARLVIGEALRIAPDHALALSIDGELAIRTGQPARAKADLERAFVASHQVRYLIDEARALDLLGDRAGAATLRDQVEAIVRDELTTGRYGHRLELVEVLLDRSDPTRAAEAVAIAREEVGLRPSAESHYQLARALAWSGAHEEARIQIQAALASGARQPQYYELASRLELVAGDYQRAILYERLAIQLDPVNAGWRTIGMPL